MTTYVSAELQAGLDAARMRRAKRRSRLRVEGGGTSHPVLRLWERRAGVGRADRPPLRGPRHLYDGARHIGGCLGVTSDEQAREPRSEFNRALSAPQGAALDFARDEDAPVALIPDARGE